MTAHARRRPPRSHVRVRARVRAQRGDGEDNPDLGGSRARGSTVEGESAQFGMVFGWMQSLWHELEPMPNVASNKRQLDFMQKSELWDECVGDLTSTGTGKEDLPSLSLFMSVWKQHFPNLVVREHRQARVRAAGVQSAPPPPPPPPPPLPQGGHPRPVLLDTASQLQV